MLSNVICLAVAGYSLVRFFHKNSQRGKQDIVAMLILNAIIIGYCIPYPKFALPTIESVYTCLYQPVSKYFLQKVGL